MQITATGMQMASAHASTQDHELTESLRMWAGRQLPRQASQTGTRPAAQFPPQLAPEESRARRHPTETVRISDAARQAARRETSPVEASDSGSIEDPRLLLLREILFRLTGQDIEVFGARALKQNGSAPEIPQTPAQQQGTPSPAASPAISPAGWGIEYNRHERYTEAEQTTLSASGTVQTADGREISFSVALSMSRSYREESDVRLRLGDAARQQKDPLVVNFSGSAAQLLDQRFNFDLNANGTTESINRLAAGSGFLVFDRNGDGRANDGSELFGTNSGDGFADLATLDNDGNGWIDEGDAAYAALRVWTPDAEGSGALRTLQEAGVGAISLDRIATPFKLKDGSNTTLGEVKSSGVYLREDGSAGTVQLVDLSI